MVVLRTFAIALFGAALVAGVPHHSRAPSASNSGTMAQPTASSVDDSGKHGHKLKSGNLKSATPSGYPQPSPGGQYPAYATPLGNQPLKTNVAPGGNFDLSLWNLQLPFGQNGHPDVIKPAQLVGPAGYQDPSLFYTDQTDGSLVMKVIGAPGTPQCVTTPNSNSCRTELREIKPPNWSPKNPTNRLSADIMVKSAGTGPKGTCIGQVHLDPSVSVRPVCELYYNSQGDLQLGVQQTTQGGSEVLSSLGNVPIGQRFTYTIAYEASKLTVTINGKAQEFPISQLGDPLSYFKVGNYRQGTGVSEVHFYAISTQH